MLRGSIKTPFTNIGLSAVLPQQPQSLFRMQERRPSFSKSFLHYLKMYFQASSWTCSICQRRLKNEAEDGGRARFCTLRSAGMAVVAQNRFKTYSKRQDSFHFEKMDLTEGLSVPNEQARRHSTGNVGNGTINIAALQPNLENLKVNVLKDSNK